MFGNRNRIEAPRQIGQAPQAQGDITTTHTPGRISLSGVLRTLKPVALGVGLALFVVLFWYAAQTVHNLFAVTLHAPDEALLAVGASVGVVLGTLLIILASTRHLVRGLAEVCLFVWLLLTLTLISLEATVKGGLLSVPESFASIGRVIAALLAAIALVPAITIPLVAMQPAENDAPSDAAAIGRYIGFVAKGVAVAASIFASAYFGLSRGMPVEVAVLCGFIIESCFIWSYFHLIEARQNHDGFDIALWSVALIMFGAFVALVSMETISTLSNIQVPFLSELTNAGAVIFTIAIGLAIFLTVVVAVLTNAINVRLRKPDGVIDANARSLSRRVADSIIGARQARREIGAAWRGELPERTQTQAQPQAANTFAKDAESVTAMPADEPAPNEPQDALQSMAHLGLMLGLLNEDQYNNARAALEAQRAARGAEVEDGPKA